MEYYLGNEVLIQSMIYRNHENIVLSEHTNHKISHSVLSCLYKMSSIGKCREIESKLVFVRCWQEGGMRSDC
jgi:hypothetical protein